MTARLREIQLAFMLLTRLPVGRLPDPAPSLAQAAWAYPLVGLVTGAALWAAMTAALWLGFSPTIAAFVALGLGAFLTGGLHFDGLADFADGIGGGRDRDHALEIMRDSRIGSYGALALVIAIGLTAGALAQLAGVASLPIFLLIGVGARLAMLAVMLAMRPARNDGLGHQTRVNTTKSLLVGGVLCLGLGGTLDGTAIVVLGAMGVTGLIVARIARKRIAGYTGDVLGAVVVLCEMAGFLAFAAIIA